MLVVCVAVDDCQRRLLALGLVLHASVQQLAQRAEKTLVEKLHLTPLVTEPCMYIL